MTRRAWIVIVVLVCSPVPSRAEEPSKEVRYLLAGMQAEREKLRSGSCVINGADAQGKFTMTYHFDGASVRCDRTGATPGLPANNKDTQYFAKTASVAYLYSPQSNPKSIHIYRATKFPDGSSLGYWDLRTAGLSVYMLSTRHSLPQALKSYRKALGGNVKAVNANGVWTLTIDKMHSDAYSTHDTIEIDENQGFGVTRITASSTTGNDRVKKQDFETKTEWKQIDKVWVPVREQCKHSNPGASFEYSINWLKANAPIDAELLNYRSFPVPPETPVADYSLGAGRVIEHNSTTDPTVSVDRPQKASWWVRRAGFVVAVVFVLGGAAFVVRGWRRPVVSTTEPPVAPAEAGDKVQPEAHP